MMDEPQTTEEAARRLLELAVSGFDDWASLGDIRASRDGDLLLLNYTTAAQYARHWNTYELACRGLVLDAREGMIVARSFDKFFNWGEGGRTTDAPISYVQEKMDGSLIIAFWHDGRYRAVTRGSFTSPQAAWAEQQLAGRFAGIQACWTLLFEAVYPENRVVVDYGGRSGLYLLAMRHRATGAYAPLDFVRTVASSEDPPFPLPVVYDRLDTVDGIQQALSGMTANEEGFVAVFEDGSRFKFKSAAYLELHKALSGLSFKNTVEAVRDGRVDDVRQIIPEEFLVEFNDWVDRIEKTVEDIVVAVEVAMSRSPVGNRKEFAAWALGQPEIIRPYLFARLDGKDIKQMIFHIAFKDIKA